MLKIIDLLYPRRCPVCDEILFPGKVKICVDCRSKIIYIKEPTCKKCGKPLKCAEAEYCADCMEKSYFYKEGAALFSYPPLKQSLYRFKYGGRQEYADFYAEEIVRFLNQKIAGWNAEALIPVPLHKDKKRVRGYNQAEVLADAISKRTGIPVCASIVERVKNTIPQKQLDETARQNNLKRAFKIYQNDVKLNTIIIIDDIYTTGSTINALSYTCRNAGIKDIYFLTVAIGES